MSSTTPNCCSRARSPSRPTIAVARHEYAIVLVKRHKHVEARREMEKLLQLDPAQPRLPHDLRDGVHRTQRLRSALPLYREVLAETPNDPELHLSIAHALKTLGRTEEAIASYRAAATARPRFGEAYWSLANLKTYRFTDAEIARMRSDEAAGDTALADRYHLCFALGKALEDRAEYAESFAYYERGNALKKTEMPLPAGTAGAKRPAASVDLHAGILRRARPAAAARIPAPIFIVGLPRSGSTLIEQILASHSRVEGTMELADIPRLVQELQGREKIDVDSALPGDPGRTRARMISSGSAKSILTSTRVYRNGQSRSSSTKCRIISGISVSFT